MSDANSGQHSNRISVCPLSSKLRRMKSQDKNKKEEYITDLKRGEQVYAVKSYSDHRNNISLAFVEGDIITLLDQFTDGMCKGFISRLGPESKIGVFPTTCVVPFTKNNINSPNINNLSKCSRKNIESKEKQKSISYSVAIREKEKATLKESIPQAVVDSGHMYSCNYIETKKSPNTDQKASMLTETLNRGSTCSVDSGRGSTTVTMMNSIKMNIAINPLSTFDQSQYIPENYVSQSIESGLASYQRHSSSSSSSLGGGSSTDGSKHNIGFSESEHRQILNTTFEEEDRDGNVIKIWLQNMNLEIYTTNFINSGYDFHTLLRMTPEDLNAIGITNPKHRKQIKSDISKRIGTIRDNFSENIPSTVEEWLMFLNLNEYSEIILQQGYDNVEKITDITWEDLEEIGIKKLGHQKKIILAVERLKKLIKSGPSDKLSMSFSAENFRDPKAKFTTSDSSPNYNSRHDCQSTNPAYLDLSRHSSPRPRPPVRQGSQQIILYSPSNVNVMYSPAHSGRTSLIDSSIPPPTPKRISSIMSTQTQIHPSPQNLQFRKPYENLNESIDIVIKSSKPGNNVSTFMSSNDNSSSIIEPSSPSNVRHRSTSIMLTEINCLPFANENCGTIKQRSSSLDRTDALREEIEFGVLGLKTNMSQIAKPVLPLTLPYTIDSLSYKSTNSSQKFKVSVSSERKVQNIPSDVDVAVREKVPLPKLHIEDNSSNEDFNEICDMLEDLTELLDKEVSQNN